MPRPSVSVPGTPGQGAAHAPSATHASRVAFIGRKSELATLAAALDDALVGRGRMVLITGEPGIGKSRTIEEIASHADARGAEVLVGRCYEDDGAPAFWPWVQIIRAYARSRSDRDLATVLGAEAAELVQIAPDLRRRLPELPPLPSRDGESARFRLFDATASFLCRAAGTRPIVVVLDDLHGADPSSLLLLQFLARQMRDAALLVVGTFRDGDLTRGGALDETLAELLREPICERLALRGLSEPEVARFLATLSGVPQPPAVATLVHQRTDGIPLFLSEVGRFLLESGALARATLDDSVTLAIPQGVRLAIQRRLAQLSAPSVELLGLAAGFGREFREDALAQASGIDRERLAALLTAVIDAGIVGASDRPGRYRFAHALTRDTVYDQVPAPYRAELHRRLGAALESVSVAEAEPPFAEIAAHFLAASDPRGIEYARRAGDSALEVLAYEEAAHQYEAALESLDRGVVGSEDARCELLLALGNVRAQSGDMATARLVLLRAADEARRCGRPEQLARAALHFGVHALWHWGDGRVDPIQVSLLEEALAANGQSDSPVHVKLLSRLATALVLDHEGASRRAGLAADAVAMARRLGDRASLAYALHAQHVAGWSAANVAQRLDIARELAEVADALRDRGLAFYGYFWRFCDHLELGDAAALEVDFSMCRSLEGELRDPYYTSHLLLLRGIRALVAGTFEQVEGIVGDVLALVQRGWRSRLVAIELIAGRSLWMSARQRGHLELVLTMALRQTDDGPLLGMQRCILAAAYAEVGSLEEARREYEWFLPSGLSVLPRDFNLLLALSHLADTCRILEDERGAAVLYEALLPYERVCVTIGNATGFLGAVALYLGMLAGVRSRWDDAAQHLDDALAVHLRLRSTPWIARTHYEYAVVLLGRAAKGDRERAHALLAQTRATAEAIGMTALLAKVNALLAQAEPVGAEVEAQPLVPDNARIADEARLAKDGQSVAAIATRPESNVFRREGEYWTIVYHGTGVRLRDTKGLRYIAYLLAHPTLDVHVADLATLGSEGEGGAGAGASAEGNPRRAVGGDLGDVLDPRARAEYRQRLVDLREQLEDATSAADAGRIDRLHQEIEVIGHELSSAYGLGGRARRAGDPTERQRKAVTNRIRVALERINAEHPMLGRHLANTLRTGFLCAYVPELLITWLS